MSDGTSPGVPEAPPSVPAPPTLGGSVPPQSSTLSHWQVPAEQANPGVQARPHAPQFAAFDVTSTQPVTAQQNSFAAQPGPLEPLHEQTLLPELSRQRSPGRHATWLHSQTRPTHSMPPPLPQSFLKSQLH
jgi:hypothetical protein